MRVYYLDLNVVDCTSDPHILDYDAVEKMLEDVLKVCESDVVRAINVVRLSIGKEYEIIEDRGTTVISEEKYESDYYTVLITKEEYKKVAKGPYAKKHKVEEDYASTITLLALKPIKRIDRKLWFDAIEPVKQQGLKVAVDACVAEITGIGRCRQGIASMSIDADGSCAICSNDRGNRILYDGIEKSWKKD